MTKASNATSHSYSGPWARNRLLQMRNYVASPNFLDRVVWNKSAKGTRLIESKLPSEAASHPKLAYMSVVGEVSGDMLVVDTEKAFNPTYNEDPRKKSKFVVQLVPPEDPHFVDDFHMAVNRLGIIQRKAIRKDVKPAEDSMQHFILDQGGFKSLRFTSPLLVPREKPLRDIESELDSETENWPWPDDHLRYYAHHFTTHRVNPLVVWGPDDRALAPEEFAGALKGALVELYFSLSYFWIHSSKVNSFSATIEQIVILRGALPDPPNPFKLKASRGSIWRPSRSELEGAANTFLPVKNVTATEAEGTLKAGSSHAVGSHDDVNDHSNQKDLACLSGGASEGHLGGESGPYGLINRHAADPGPTQKGVKRPRDEEDESSCADDKSLAVSGSDTLTSGSEQAGDEGSKQKRRRRV